MDPEDILNTFLNPLRRVHHKFKVKGYYGSRTIKEVSEKTVDSKSGSIDTHITETNLRFDCGCLSQPEGGICDICHAVVCSKCYQHCAACGRALCNRCAFWLEDKPFCEDCHWNEKLIAIPRFFAGLFGKKQEKK